MNERIIEMAIAARFNPVNCTGGNVPLFEKFAELIVMECVDYAFANGDNVDYLKQYFGVKKC